MNLGYINFPLILINDILDDSDEIILKKNLRFLHNLAKDKKSS
jgi:hypothetical protein